MGIESRSRDEDGCLVGYSWLSTKHEGEDKHLNGVYLQRCHDCGKENHSMVVAGGQCAWCGFQETEESIKEREGVA